ncbi:MAG TPA: DUF917 domain-containing protein [Anaerovoracaceae bacterium]|nr:DUF917 domain-containing protein [Anaerovoracaceae bacterium]
MRTLSKQEVIDILYGCTVVGTGGGGSLPVGLEMIEKDYANGKSLKLIELSEIPDEGLIASPYGCGAPLYENGEEDPRYAGLPRLDDSAAILAFTTLQDYMGEKFCAVSSTELGGENTAEAIHIAMALDIPLADSDPAGRSVPELQHSSFYVKGIPIAPLACATNFGDTVILNNTVNDLRAEAIVRAIAVVSGDEVGVADHPMRGKEFRNSVIPGAISWAQKIGETLRLSNEKKLDTAQIIASGFDGKVLFRGLIEESPWECRDGFNYGTINVKGIKEFEGDNYEIGMQNENIFSKKNGVVDACVPDLICMLNKDGYPVTNPNWTIGEEVTIFALPSPDIWKTEAGQKVFSTTSFNLGFDYKSFK